MTFLGLFFDPIFGVPFARSSFGIFFRERNPPHFLESEMMFSGARAPKKQKEELVTIVNHEHLRWPKLYISSPHPRVRHAEPLFPDSAA